MARFYEITAGADQVYFGRCSLSDVMARAKSATVRMAKPVTIWRAYSPQAVEGARADDDDHAGVGPRAHEGDSMNSPHYSVQVTEWHHPGDTVDVVVQGACKSPGMVPKIKKVPFAQWARSEADRLNGRVKKRVGGLIAVFR